MPMCSWACLGPCPMVFGENKKSCWEKVLKSINFHTYCQSIICSDSGPVEIKGQVPKQAQEHIGMLELENLPGVSY